MWSSLSCFLTLCHSAILLHSLSPIYVIFSSRCMPELRFAITQQQNSVLRFLSLLSVLPLVYGPLTQVLAKYWLKNHWPKYLSNTKSTLLWIDDKARSRHSKSMWLQVSTNPQLPAVWVPAFRTCRDLLLCGNSLDIAVRMFTRCFQVFCSVK